MWWLAFVVVIYSKKQQSENFPVKELLRLKSENHHSLQIKWKLINVSISFLAKFIQANDYLNSFQYRQLCGNCYTNFDNVLQAK